MKQLVTLIFLLGAVITRGQSPGDVSTGIVFWLKADAGTSTTTDGATISTWTDQTGNGHTASGFTSNPRFKSVLANFNPAIDLTSVTGGFSLSNSSSINTTSNAQKSFTIVFRTGTNITTRQLIYEEGGGTHGLNLYITGGRLYNNLWVSSADNANSVAITADTDYILTFVYNGSSSRWDSYLNGSLAYSDATVPTSLPSHTGAIGIGIINSATQYNGGVDVSSGDPFFGHIMEFMYYNAKAFTTLERQRIETYLALKYAITLTGNYTAADGSTIIWNSTTNAGYTAQITGIGRDISEGLNQKQAGSQGSGRLVSMGLGSVAASNVTNGSTFPADHSYMLWGDNGGAISFSPTGAPTDRVVLNRKWRMDETGTIGSVKVQVPASTSSGTPKMKVVNTLDLLVDSDGDFTSGATTYPMTLVGTNWEADVNFADGDYFTFSFEGARVSVTTHGNETGPISIVFEFLLPDPNTSGVALTYDINLLGTSTAANGFDHSTIPPSAQFIIANGASSDTYTVTVTDDGWAEGDETVVIMVDNPSDLDYPIGLSQATAIIYDNDTVVPGGININPTFWFRADDSTSTVINGNPVVLWYDKAKNGHDATAGTTPATFTEVGANFNPAITFSLSGDGYLIGDDNEINLLNYSAKSYIVAFRTGSDISTLQLIYEQGGGTNGLNLYIESNLLKVNFWIGSTEEYGSVAIAANQVYVGTFIYNGGSGRWDFYLNGILATFDASVPSTFSAHSGDIGLGYIENDTQFDGGRDVSSGQPFSGDIMEMLYYNEVVLTSTQRSKGESYMALKYGAPYQANLVASDGTTVVWNATANATYTNSVAGLAGDGSSAIYQKQSYSSTLNDILTIGLTSIEVDNATNTGAFSTGQDFLVWGHNTGNLASVASTAALPKETGIADRLDRLWLIVETGTVETVKMAFPKDSIDLNMTYISYGNLYLRVADDDSLKTNPVDLPLTTETINGVVSYTATNNFSGTKYFSFIQKGLVIWDGSNWRGGLSVTTPHGPSDDPSDQTKALHIFNGDTAVIEEGVHVNSASIQSGAVACVKPGSCFKVTTITNSGDLMLEANSTGFGQYQGPAVTATFQQYIDDDGWHLIGSPFSDTDWDDLTFKNSNGFVNHPLGGSSLDSCTYCNLWWYDASTDNGADIGFGSSDAFGTWKSSVNGSESFTPTKGWNLYLDEANNFATAPWTVSITGTFNNGNITQQVNENNAGWNLVANPYPSALNWDVIDDDLGAAGIANGYHVWDHENTNYAVYANGSGTYGLVNYIAPFQGFYVQTSTAGTQASGDVFRNFDLQNVDRPTTCPTGLGNVFKTDESDRILIRTKHLNSGKIDEAILRFDETAFRGFNTNEDTRKLFTPYQDVPSLYSKSGKNFTSINSIPLPVNSDSVLMGTRAFNGSQISIEAIEAPAGYTIYLEDVKTGTWHRVDREAYKFKQDNSIMDRFWLHFGPAQIEAKPWSGSNPFTIYMKDDVLMVETQKSITQGEWYIANMNGTVLQQGAIFEGTGHNHQIDISRLSHGAYIFVLMANQRKYAEKLVK